MMYNFVFDRKDYTLEDEIKFRCYKGISCFNRCCYDVKLVLTPYDFLRLRKALNLGVEEFIEKYGEVYFGEVTQLPVISINVEPYSLACPFLDEKEGCRVYPHRPSSCRLYPLARYVIWNEKGEKEEIFKIIRETHCKGHFEDRRIKIKDYMKEQGLEEYNYYNDIWAEIVHKRQQKADTPLTGDMLELIFILAYDLPRLREYIQTGEIDIIKPEDITGLSDENLLEISLKCIRDRVLSEDFLF